MVLTTHTHPLAHTISLTHTHTYIHTYMVALKNVVLANDTPRVTAPVVANSSDVALLEATLVEGGAWLVDPAVNHVEPRTSTFVVQLVCRTFF